MRPILCLLGTMLLVASIYAYTKFADRVRATASIVSLQQASGDFSVEITCTFDCEPSTPFDLPALEVRLADQIVAARSEELPRLTRLVVERLPQVIVGRNEIIVQAHVSEIGDATESGCLRIQVFQDGAPVAEETFWSEPGQPLVTGAIIFVATSNSEVESP